MVNSLQIIKILSFHLNFFFFEIHIMYFCQRKQNKQNRSKTDLFES